MNGEIKELYDRLDKRISIQENKFEIWKEIYDKNYSEIKNIIIDLKNEYVSTKDLLNTFKIDLLNEVNKSLEKIDNLPCEVHSNELKWLKGSLYLLSSVVLIIVGTIIRLWLNIKIRSIM